MRLLLAIVALLSPLPAIAQPCSASLSWTPPTLNTDGSAYDDPGGYELFYGQASRDYIASVRIEDPGVTAYEVESLTEGQWFFALTAISAAGEVSALSNEATRQINGPCDAAPEPPTDLVVTAPALTAYAVQTSRDAIALLPVGTVPAGTACDGEQSVRDRNGVLGYRVPRDAVEWAGSVRAEAVFARCQ